MIFRLLIILSYFIVCSSSFAQTIIQGKAKIIDGDTIHIGNNKIRLHGIDAPEINQTCTTNNNKWNCGLESKKNLEDYILIKEVYCEIIDKDKYNRLIGICFVNNNNMNQYMVRNGWAIAYRYYSLDYISDEAMAKDKHLGIWKGSFQEPYLFRKNQKN